MGRRTLRLQHGGVKKLGHGQVGQQLAALQVVERERSLRLMRRTKLLKTLATLAAIILAIFVICAAVYLLNPHTGLSGH